MNMRILIEKIAGLVKKSSEIACCDYRLSYLRINHDSKQGHASHSRSDYHSLVCCR
jgi:hypothetical protein